MKLLIDSTEYQQKVLDCIYSEQIDKFFGVTYFKNLPEADMCKQAMIYGMAIAAMMTSRCDHVVIKVWSMVEIKFKNGSYIKTIQNTESYKRSKQATEQWMYWWNRRVLNNERYWEQNPNKFLEEFYGLKLFQYQKLLFKLWFEE